MKRLTYIHTFNFTTLLFAICIAIGFSSTLVAADQKKRIVLQLTDNSAQKQVLVLNVADNLLKKYKDKLELEIVAFGPGLQLLFAENAENNRVNQLAKQGIRFSACRNTAKKMEAAIGHKPDLNQYAVETDGGAARIIDLVEQGYILLRP